MDRKFSRSVPYLPRYQSVSPARSPRLDSRRFTSLRSISQPNQRIFYIDSAPTRVINSYVHHSPSSHRAFKVHLVSSAKINHLTRNTKSQSVHDLNSSHVYTSPGEIFDKSIKEAAARQVGSCDDIYHKAPFFPDVTPSESGVSVGESEEGSIFDGEDDNLSQHSFGSSSAFYEVTMDSELDRCDSDNLSGPESVNLGDRTLNVLYGDEKKKRARQRSAPSPDTYCTSPLSYGEARRRELMSSPSSDFDKTNSRYQALRIQIPGNEASAKAFRDQTKSGDRKSVSSSPLAQSTPHVSPRGTGETRFYVTASWNADDPYNELSSQKETIKSKTARTLFDLDISDLDTRHSSRIEDSSCNSSCSEDNFSDISNATISSPIPRKTKLVKKSSDRPASARTHKEGLLGQDAMRYSGHAKPAETSLSFMDTSSGYVGSDNSESITTSHLVDADNLQAGQTLAKLSPDEGSSGGQVQEKRGEGEWWAVYNIGTATERQARATEGSPESEKNLSNFQQNIRIVKPLNVNIPLITAGKQGQERLRKRSQTSPPLTRSPPKSPTLSRGGSPDEKGGQKQGEQISEQGKSSTSHYGQLTELEHGELMQYNQLECHTRRVDEHQDEKHEGRDWESVRDLSPTPQVSEQSYTTQERVDRETVSSERGNISRNAEYIKILPGLLENATVENGCKMFAKGTNDMESEESKYVQGTQVNNFTEIDSSLCTMDDLPSKQKAISSSQADGVNNDYQVSDSTEQVSWLTSGQFVDGTSGTEVDSMACEAVTREEMWESGSVVSDGGNDSSRGGHGLSDQLGNGQVSEGLAWETQDKFSTTVSLPARTAQVSEGGEVREGPGEAGSGSTGKPIQLATGTSGSQDAVSSQRKPAESGVNILPVCYQESEEALKTGISGESLSTASSTSEKHVEFQRLSGLDVVAEVDSLTDQLDKIVLSNVSETVNTNKLESCDICDGHLDKLDRRLSSEETGIDLGSQNDGIKEDGQQQHWPLQRVSECPQSTSQVDPVIVEENNDMAQSIDPRPASWGDPRGAAKCRETPHMCVRVVATAQRVDDTGDSDNNINNYQGRNSAFFSLQQNGGTTSNVHQSSPLPASNNIYEQSNITDPSNEAGPGGQYTSTSNSRLDNDDASSLGVSRPCTNADGWRQQEAHSSDFYTSLPVVEQSIPEPARGPRCDKGIHEDQSFCAVKDGEAFVERGEQFLPAYGEREKPVTVTEISSKHVKRIQRTKIEKIVTTERKVNHSPTGFVTSYDDSGSSVDVVTNTSTTETIIKEDEDYVTTSTTNTLYSGAEDYTESVSNNDNLDHTDTYTTCLSSAPVTATTTTPSRCDEFLDTPTASSPSLVSTARSVDSVSDTAVTVMRGTRDVWDSTDSRPSELGQAWPSVPTAISTGGVGQAHTTASDTGESVMHHVNPLDSLQAQLSCIGNDLSPADTGTGIEVTNSVYHDHAEATSVLKEIVRGENGEVSNFRRSGRETVITTRKFTDFDLSVITDNTSETNDTADGSRNGHAQVCREQYDNDYDFVTTDLPKHTKSLRSNHIQLLKPGHLKASSLWTLQEETESVIDSLTPKPSPTRSQPNRGDSNNHQSSPSFPPSDHTQWGVDRNENEKNSRALNSAFGQRTLASESSDFDESDGNYSSISTTESSSYRSSSYGREQTPLSDTDSVPQASTADTMDYQEVDDAIPPTDIDRISSFQDFVTGLRTDGYLADGANNSGNYEVSMGGQQDQVFRARGEHASVSTFNPSPVFNVSGPRRNQASDRLSALDNLTASLQQFGSTSFESGIEDSHSFTLTKDSLCVIGSAEDKLNVSDSTHHSWNEDAHSEASSRLHALDLDLSRISSCTSPTPSDVSDASIYTCTGTAEIKKQNVTFGHNIPSAPTSTPKTPKSPKTSLKSALKRPLTSQNKQEEVHKRKIEQFENLLNEFNKDTCPTVGISDLVILEDKQRETTDGSNFDDLYRAFTKDDSEKKQNHVCIVVEDENMSAFRFKRFLKKSHTKRKKGRRVLKFLSRLGCVSETVSSPEASPTKKVKLSDRDVPVFSTDSMPSPRHKISNPVLISSTSFHHHDLLNTSPSQTPSSSNQSLDSLRSRADSAYSSISESASAAMNSPTSLRLPSTSTLRVPPASTSSVSSSVFYTGSTSGDRSVSDSAYSTNSEATMPSFSSFSEADTTLESHGSVSEQAGTTDVDMLSALSDVFEQLDVCEGEIDTALLNRMRHGHTQAYTRRK